MPVESETKQPPATQQTSFGLSFHYAAFRQFGVEFVGTSAYLSPATPLVPEGDFHSLAEVSAQSADLQQIVEVGWTVDRLVNGDSLPRIFVFHWINGIPQCYNACGYPAGVSHFLSRWRR